MALVFCASSNNRFPRPWLWQFAQSRSVILGVAPNALGIPDYLDESQPTLESAVLTGRLSAFSRSAISNSAGQG